MTFGGNVRRRQAAWHRNFRSAVVLTLCCLVVGGLAGCEYAPIDPAPTLTTTPTPTWEPVNSRESRLALEAKRAELTAAVEAQLGPMPDEALSGSMDAMVLRHGQTASFSFDIVEPGPYVMITACSPDGEATARVYQQHGDASAARETLVPCGEAVQTLIDLPQGPTTVSLQPIESLYGIGGVRLLRAPPGTAVPAPK